jgi:hypothetical protein
MGAREGAYEGDGGDSAHSSGKDGRSEKSAMVSARVEMAAKAVGMEIVRETKEERVTCRSPSHHPSLARPHIRL